jgi:hypothetical protein
MVSAFSERFGWCCLLRVPGQRTGDHLHAVHGRGACPRSVAITIRSIHRVAVLSKRVA